MPLYALFNGASGDPYNYEIGAATQDAPGDPWVEEASPVLTRGTGGQWDDVQVKDPWIVWDGSQYVAFYAGSASGYPQYQVGRATAASPVGPWTRDASNPVLAQGAGGAVDDTAVLMPIVLYEPSDVAKPWKMWYGANDGSVMRVAYAHSSDGIHWTKVGAVISPGSAGTWDDYWVHPGAIVKDGATYYLFVVGAQDATVPKWQGGVWTFTDPEGTYTPYAGNPTLKARFNDAGTSQLLTATMTSGSKVVHVADTSAFVEGEPVIVWDSDTATGWALVTHIDTIDSSTQVTLVDAAPTTYGTTQSAVMRPFTYTSVNPRTVRRYGSGWEMYIAPHQAIIDLAAPPVTEGAMRATAPTLLSDWTLDRAGGLMFPLPRSGWHGVSAENPTVIAEIGSFTGGTMGAEAGVPSDTVFSIGSDVLLLTRPIGSEAGFAPGSLFRSAGARQVMLTGSGIETPEMTEPYRSDGTPAQELDSLRYHLARTPTWEEPEGGGPGTIDWGETGDIAALPFGAAASGGSLDEAARADHVHAMPAEPAAGGGLGPILVADDHSVPLVFGDLLQTEEGDDLLYGEPGG